MRRGGGRWAALGLMILMAMPSPAPCFAPPKLMFDHPTEGYTFKAGSNGRAEVVVIAVRGTLDAVIPRPMSDATVYSEWGGYEVALAISGKPAGAWPAADLLNSIGEVKMEASIKDMTEGPYTATCRLMKDGEEVGTSHTVSFSVGHVPDGPSGDEHFCPSCKLADSCGGVSLGECGGKGTCHNGACICFADYAGDQCEHSILRDTAFLPSVDPRDSPSACQKSIVWEHGSRNLQSTLASLGSAHDCRLGASVSHQVIGGVLPFGPPMHGLGFNLHYVSHMLGWGLSAGRVPVLVESPALGRWAYGSHPDCDAEGWLCFFEPLSPCDSYASQLGADYSASVHNRSGGIPRVALQPPEEFARWVPGREETYHGRLWWRSQLISRILRPTSLLLSMARQARLRMGLRPPYISVHVRMGDACTHAARKSPAGGLEGCVPVLEYVDAARTLAERFGCNRVFLATDSEEAVEAFDAAGDLEVMHLALERGRLFGSTWLIEERLRAGVVDADQVVQSALLDLVLLAQGDYLVASLSGHMSRLALEYMVAEKGYVVPYMSVEGPWCFELGVDYGTGYMDFC